MDIEGARQVIFGALNTGWGATYPAYPIIFENDDEPNLDSQTTPFLMVAIEYQQSTQVAMADSDPPLRYYGWVKLDLYVRKGSGTRARNLILVYLTNLLKTKTIGGILFKEPYPIKPRSGVGWVSNTLLVPFQFDTHN